MVKIYLPASVQGAKPGMTRPAVYLLQFIGTFMIIGGGIVISSDMVGGKHNLTGWLTVILGILFLITGARKSAKNKK
jgi:uncharacterized membrane protein HdeD (DUF308 family)